LVKGTSAYLNVAPLVYRTSHPQAEGQLHQSARVFRRPRPERRSQVIL